MFNQKIQEVIAREWSHKKLTPIERYDLEVELDELTIPMLEEWDKLAPFGTLNPRPLLIFRDAVVTNTKKIGSSETHLKLEVTKNNVRFEVIGFQLAHLEKFISQSSSASILGEARVQVWNQNRKIQFQMKDIEITSWQLFDYRGNMRLQELQKSNIVLPHYIVFNQANLAYFQETINDSLRLVDTPEKAAEFLWGEAPLILLDLPPTMEVISRLFHGKRCYNVFVHFYAPQSDYFTKVASRSDFKALYQILLKRNQWSIENDLPGIAKELRQPKEVVTFMVNVLCEIEVLQKNSEFIIPLPTPAKRDLQEAKTHQDWQKKIELEQVLLYSSATELSKTIENLMTNDYREGDTPT
jgi:single-stranded-DNA-specific exonuclease